MASINSAVLQQAVDAYSLRAAANEEFGGETGIQPGAMPATFGRIVAGQPLFALEQATLADAAADIPVPRVDSLAYELGEPLDRS